jgi:hypothetical protein
VQRAYIRKRHDETPVIECGRYYWTIPDGTDPEVAPDVITTATRRDGGEEDLLQQGYARFDTQLGAELFARLQELGPSYDPRPISKEQLIEEDIGATDSVSEIEIPLLVAREGTAKIAAYLRASGVRPSTISHHLDVSESTIQQYLSDVRRGER